MSTLYDRALFDLGGPGWEPDAGHPAAGKAFSRPWNRRPMQAEVDVRAIDLRLAENVAVILGHLGIPVPDGWKIDNDSSTAKLDRLAETIAADVAAKAEPDFGEDPLKDLNLVGWFRTGEGGVSVRLALYTVGKPCVAVVGKPSPACYVSLKRRGFVEAGGMLVREWGRMDVARVVGEVFKSSERIDVPTEAVILRVVGDSPFHDGEGGAEESVPPPSETADGSDEDGWGPYDVSEREGPADDGRGFEMLDGHEGEVVRWLGRLPPAALPLPRMTPETAFGLCRAAAILHAADVRQPDMEFSAVRVYIEGLRGIAGDVVGNDCLNGSVGLLAATNRQLAEVLKLRTRHKNVMEAAGPAVRRIALQWTAIAFHESLCRKQSIPPEAADTLWRWDPFAEEADPRAETEHRAARRCERRAAKVAAVIERIPTSLEACVDALRNPDVLAALDAAIAAFPRKHDKAAVAGVDRSRIRLGWDCLAIWEEARPHDVPTVGPASNYSRLVSALFRVATGRSVDDDVATNHERLSGIFTRSTQKALLALRGQQEGAAGAPAVVVGWPVGARHGCFLRYLPKPEGFVTAGPAVWREREKRSRSTKRLKKV